MKFQVNVPISTRADIDEYYADVFLHVEEQKGSHHIIKANKAVLAVHSPYLDRMFKSTNNNHIFHMSFFGITYKLVNDAIRLLYGNSVEMNKHVGRFSEFLKMLEIEFITGGNEDDQGESLAKKLT